MEMALEKLSKQELINLLDKERALSQKEKALLEQEEKHGQAIHKHEAEAAYYKVQIAQLQRMLFGQKRERFEGDNNQLPLPFDADEQQVRQQEEQLTEKIEYVRKKYPPHQTHISFDLEPL